MYRYRYPKRGMSRARYRHARAVHATFKFLYGVLIAASIATAGVGMGIVLYFGTGGG